MLFNADKSKWLHVGHSFPNVIYSIGGVEIKNVEADNDLDVTIGCTLDSSLQCAKVVSTANKFLSVYSSTSIKYLKTLNLQLIF